MNQLPRHHTVHTIDRLNEAERLFIWGFRAMAQRQRVARPSFDDIRTVYRHFRVEDAVLSVEAMFEAAACTAHTAIELHCPHCRHTSSSELLLLQIMSDAQTNHVDRMCQRLERWLPPVAIDWFIAPARGLGQIFQEAGLVFPCRSVRPVLADDMQGMLSPSIVSPTLH